MHTKNSHETAIKGNIFESIAIDTFDDTKLKLENRIATYTSQNESIYCKWQWKLNVQIDHQVAHNV